MAGLRGRSRTLAEVCRIWHNRHVRTEDPKPVIWVGASLKDLRRFPEEVQDVMGFALYLAQIGEKHREAKPLRAFPGAGVLEIVDDHDGDTYRAVYTVRLAGRVYVLHAFQKKSHRGRSVDRGDMELIRERYRQAEEIHSEWERDR